MKTYKINGVKYRELTFTISCAACKHLGLECLAKQNPFIKKDKETCEWVNLVPVDNEEGLRKCKWKDLVPDREEGEA